MAANDTTATNIRSSNQVKIPASGRIVSITYDCVSNHAHKLAEAEWGRARTVIGIVMSHAKAYDPLRNSFEGAVKLLAIDGSRKEVLFSRIVRATSTRSVSKEARAALGAIYKWETSEAAKWDAKIRELQEQKKAACAAAGADDVAATLAAATGCLTERQFASTLRDKLCAKFAAFSRDGWEVSTWGHRVRVVRSVDIEKYYSGSMSYLEYDDSRALFSDCEQSADGQRIIERHRRELPLKAKLEERFSLGDKNWLSYQASYELADVEGCLLSEQLAEEVVAKASKRFR